MQNVDFTMSHENQHNVIQAMTAPSNRPRIALVDENDNFRHAMATCLRSEGFEVTELADIEYQAIVDVALQDDVDALLVDAAAMRVDDEPLVARLRRAGIDVPIAVMSGKFADRIEETALADGAVDFFLKHRGPTIVAKRTQLLISGVRISGGTTNQDDGIFRVGELALRLRSYRALWRQRQVPLTLTEFKIVRLLAMNHGKTFTYRQIYDKVQRPGFHAGDGPDGYRINVRALIKKIRKHFRSLDPEFKEIENIPGQGYRWRPQKQALKSDRRAVRGADSVLNERIAA